MTSYKGKFNHKVKYELFFIYLPKFQRLDMTNIANLVWSAKRPLCCHIEKTKTIFININTMTQ